MAWALLFLFFINSRFIRIQNLSLITISTAPSWTGRSFTFSTTALGLV